jgi:hypothetical protein
LVGTLLLSSAWVMVPSPSCLRNLFLIPHPHPVPGQVLMRSHSHITSLTLSHYSLCIASCAHPMCLVLSVIINLLSSMGPEVKEASLHLLHTSLPRTCCPVSLISYLSSPNRALKDWAADSFQSGPALCLCWPHTRATFTSASPRPDLSPWFC